MSHKEAWRRFNWLKSVPYLNRKGRKNFIDFFGSRYLTLSRIQYWVRVYFRSHFALNLSDSELIPWFILNYRLIQKNTEYSLWILLWFREIQKSILRWFSNPSESVLKLKFSLKMFWFSTDCQWTVGTGLFFENFNCFRISSWSFRLHIKWIWP